MEPIRVGDILDGKYEIEGTLGEGAMGVVFSARHRALNKRVAIKTLRPEISRDRTLVGRFEQEARAASSIGHPNIIEVFDLGSAPGGARYMVMEYLRGESLGDSLERQGIQPLERSIYLMMQVLSALAAAHKRGIVHRDLKPENVFVVSLEDRPDMVKLLDFGISKVLEGVADPSIQGSPERATRVGTVLGTPLYMSPEQARGALDIDHRSDLWAVGVCLYEMLTGQPPFDGENYNQILGAILDGTFREPTELNPAIPAPVEQVILRALAYDREQRFASASEMREALDAAMSGREPSGRDPVKPTAKTVAVGGAAPAPGAATGLAAAASVGEPEEEAAMLSALDRIATGEVALGAADGSAERPVPAPAAPAASAPSAPAAPPPAVSEDAFAPPESEAEDLDLDLAGPAGPAPVRPRAIGTPPPRATGGRAATRPAATAVSGGGLSFVGALKIVLVLAVLGAGGFAAYRYVTLGYVLSPPPVETVSVPVEIEPATADLIVDDKMHPERTLELEPGVPRKVLAMASGRLQHEVTVAIAEDGTPPPQLEIRLRHQVPRIGRYMAPAADDHEGPAASAGAGALDRAMVELERMADCLRPLGEAIAERRTAYLGTTRGKARHIKRNNIPDIEPFPVEVLSACRGAIQTAGNDPPSFPEIDPAFAAVMEPVDALNETLTEVGDYYDDEKYRNDGLRWGRKMHETVVSRLDEAWTRYRGVADRVADRRAFWHRVELGEMEARGDAERAHWQLRRVALAAQLWVGALVREIPPAERSARAEALAELHAEALAWAEANDPAMRAIDGGGLFLTKVGELVELSETGDASVERAVELAGESFQLFNAMVL